MDTNLPAELHFVNWQSCLTLHSIKVDTLYNYSGAICRIKEDMSNFRYISAKQSVENKANVEQSLYTSILVTCITLQIEVSYIADLHTRVRQKKHSTADFVTS